MTSDENTLQEAQPVVTPYSSVVARHADGSGRLGLGEGQEENAMKTRDGKLMNRELACIAEAVQALRWSSNEEIAAELRDIIAQARLLIDAAERES